MTSCSSFSPRKNAVTGTWSASDSRARVARLGDAWAFSIFDSMPLDSPLSAASCPTVQPSCRRNSLTRAAIAAPSASSRPAPRLPISGTGRAWESSASSAMRETTLLLLPEVRGLPEDPRAIPAVDICFLRVASRLVPGRWAAYPRGGNGPSSETLSLVHKLWPSMGLLAVHLADEGCPHDRDMRLRGGPARGLR